MGYFSRLKQKVSDKWGKSYASSYWYDDYERSYSAWDRYTDWGYDPVKVQTYKKSANIYKLTSVRRAIANFVQIVTGKKIEVTYATKSDSHTDGTKVVLSADVDDNFDVAVGLALHEGSHIILSDFNLLTGMERMMVWFESGNDMGPHCTGKYITQKRDIFRADGRIRTKIGLNRTIYGVIMGLCNWIEDRRIDNYIYTTAPGYRNYYVTLYDHYFNDKIVTKGIASDEYTEETIESYFFRIINLLNEKTDLSKLKGLGHISRMLDIKNISRIKSSEQSLELAIDILCKIMEYTTEHGDGLENMQKMRTTGDGEDNDEEVEIDDISDMDLDSSETSGKGGKGVKARLSPKALEQLKKKIEKQKDFLNGIVKKKKLTKEELAKIESAEESGTELQRVGVNLNGKMDVKGVDCVVVKRVTEATLDNGEFPLNIRRDYSSHVQRGIQLGTLLGKKLQVRAESRETIFNRLRQGKIDRRNIASLGYENDSVFFNHHIDQYKNVNLHISLDYSGSMLGSKHHKTIVATSAIVKACAMARNIQVQVSLRTTTDKSMPWIGVIYDSRRDSIKKYTKFMSMIGPNHTTPEGLCFEAIQKYLIPVSNEMDSYFLNFSDGQPSFESHRGDQQITYDGMAAAKHTAAQIKKMKENGIQVLSYYISEYTDVSDSYEDWRIFKACYGDDAKHVNVENMMEVAKTINNMFLKK